jgi:hypothetical protein
MCTRQCAGLVSRRLGAVSVLHIRSPRACSACLCAYDSSTCMAALDRVRVHGAGCIVHDPIHRCIRKLVPHCASNSAAACTCPDDHAQRRKVKLQARVNQIWLRETVIVAAGRGSHAIYSMPWLLRSSNACVHSVPPVLKDKNLHVTTFVHAGRGCEDSRRLGSSSNEGARKLADRNVIRCSRYVFDLYIQDSMVQPGGTLRKHSLCCCPLVGNLSFNTTLWKYKSAWRRVVHRSALWECGRHTSRGGQTPDTHGTLMTQPIA